MRFASAVFFSGLLAAVSAHFQLQYPPPRGDFVEDKEPTFCDGYSTAVSNRTVFPTTGGKISINSEHPQWTLGGIIATVQNPDSFDNFTVNGAFQYVVPFFKTSGEGGFCFPLDLAAQNISGAQNGANVTIQLIFDGGDGQLYQCADLTLSDSATIPDSVSCTNATDAAVTPVSTAVATATATSSGTSTASASATQTSNAASAKNVMGLSGAAGVLAAIAALL
ncbi:uncharacterized protein TRAVEDRAFT_159607 [Trametes versicolor FP-101664 SS1]|uniref:uncharacterized protein n=1 Tax=Trametes versicolor (strain FP-101664) TaxID=717944 RepID=UPI0004621420|nr:uncharacterized protein TRAVEDRAFT_159607 [Trametes versicolor FP-101664 SS1]EIW64881.1 hypothetical protein TRAVEDRAFT_159607 [Trametes versicolor FP-101664 SS1]